MTAVTYTANKGLNLLGSEVFVGFVNQTSGSETSSITDYSGNSPVNDLTVTGTLTKTAVATSAESMGFSGWSGSNYASSAYDADYDFGTDDFFIQCWVKETANTDIEYIMMRSYYSGSYSGSGIYLRISADGTLSGKITNNGFVGADTINGTTTIDDGAWRLVTFVRRSTKLELWVNNAKDASDVTISTATGSLSNGSATLRVGYSQGSTNPLTHGTIALMKIGAFAPTAAQIKSTYDAEKILFKANEIYTQVGTSYSTNITATQLTKSNTSIRNQARSISGVTETIHERYDERWSVTTGNVATASLSTYRRFLDSALAGNSFTLDPYGSVSPQDDPVTCIMDADSYTESRIDGLSLSNAQYRMSFDAIVL